MESYFIDHIKKIEIDTILEYRDGLVYIEKMNTNEIPAMLSWRLLEALNHTIIEFYKSGK